jgi:hypothetical protein
MLIMTKTMGSVTVKKVIELLREKRADPQEK